MKETNNNVIRTNLLRNTKLIVSLASSGENNYYDSRIEDIDDEKIIISMPSRKGMPVPVVKGSLLHVSALAANGRVTFDAKVQSVIKDPFYMLAISMPEILRHEQMRQFYRVPVHLRVKVFLGDLEKMKRMENSEDGIPYEDGLVDDISGGGCRLSTQAELHEGYNIVVDFTNTAMDGVGRVQCRVVRVSPRPNNRKVASIRYWDIEELTRDRIVRYVFRRQLDLRKVTL